MAGQGSPAQYPANRPQREAANNARVALRKEGEEERHLKTICTPPRRIVIGQNVDVPFWGKKKRPFAPKSQKGLRYRQLLVDEWFPAVVSQVFDNEIMVVYYDTEPDEDGEFHETCLPRALARVAIARPFAHPWMGRNEAGHLLPHTISDAPKRRVDEDDESTINVSLDNPRVRRLERLLDFMEKQPSQLMLNEVRPDDQFAEAMEYFNYRPAIPWELGDRPLAPEDREDIKKYLRDTCGWEQDGWPHVGHDVEFWHENERISGTVVGYKAEHFEDGGDACVVLDELPDKYSGEYDWSVVRPKVIENALRVERKGLAGGMVHGSAAARAAKQTRKKQGRRVSWADNTNGDLCRPASLDSVSKKKRAREASRDDDEDCEEVEKLKSRVARSDKALEEERKVIKHLKNECKALAADLTAAHQDLHIERVQNQALRDEINRLRAA